MTVFGPSGIGKTRLSLELSQFVADQGGRVIRGRSTPYGASTPVQRVRPAGQADRAHLRQRRARARLREALRRGRRACRAGGGRGARAPPGDAARPRERGRRRRPRDAVLLRPGARRVARAARPDAAALRGHPLGRRSLLDLLETFAGRVHDVPVFFVALARPELLTSRPAWCGGVSVLHGAPARPAQPGGEPRARPAAARERPATSARRRSPRRPRGTRSSSRSCRRRSPSARQPRPAGCPPACRRSSRPGSTRCRRTSGGCSSTHPWSAVSSGAAR